MTDDTKSAVRATLIRIDGHGVIDYGPPDPTQLMIAGINEHGARQEVVFASEALRQLAKLLNEIDERIPGALRGH